jgi:hypothetical protein
VNTRRAWSSWLVIFLAWPAFAASAAEPAVEREAASAVRRGNVLSLRTTNPVAQDHRAEIRPFVGWATAGDLAALVNAFDDVPVRVNGAAAIEHFAANEVIPFFLDAVRLDDAIRVTQANFEDGTQGHMAYAYVVTVRGEARPFVIAWRGSAVPLRVMDLQLGRCVKDRHPVSAGHCDR